MRESKQRVPSRGKHCARGLPLLSCFSWASRDQPIEEFAVSPQSKRLDCCGLQFKAEGSWFVAGMGATRNLELSVHSLSASPRGAVDDALADSFAMQKLVVSSSTMLQRSKQEANSV